MGSAFQTNLDTLNSKKSSESAQNHSGDPSVPLKYTVDICTSMPQKALDMTLIIEANARIQGCLGKLFKVW